MNSPLEKLEVFPWNENLDTGIAVIDAQHRKLVSLLNQLAATLTRGNLLETNDIFTKLTQYAEFHFETEEAIWAEHLGDDSWLSSHQLSHSSFLPKVLELKESEATRSHTEVIESIILFLIRWLAFHILDSDKRMAFFIQHRHAGLSFDDAKIASDKKMSGSIRLVIETVMHMYDSLSSTTLELMRESHKRLAIEKELHKANKQLLKANLRLEALAITDQLTDLYNRRHFNNVFARELKRAKRDKAPLALIMLDIDHFKKINDQLGHSAGDRVLIQVGQKLKEICHRPGDFPFRLGGEEFCILAANLDHQGTAEFAEIIRKKIEDLNIPNQYMSTQQYLTVSIGCVTQIPGKADTIDSFMSMADTRLYQAKEQGRNRVVCGA
ncbi:GGDEF domain-containing protein [Nitrosomonas sp. sh817]|uniref:GGDEF domain-containing protein n=2 Tax=unclassified Nitrosomonas TaxID=2609265 RepID=UPI0027DD7257|nr:diguanylate cyclase [Nitrosomonas sp. sh817]WMJ09768.1 diguanylate cyclase [Nitrosomonas sp. sh817]